MRAPVLALLSISFITQTHAQNWHWATAFLGTGQPQVKSVAALEDGGALVCGIFNDTLRTSISSDAGLPQWKALWWFNRLVRS